MNKLIAEQIKNLEGTKTSKRKSEATYTRIAMEKLYPNVGRNEKCPCGSGKKFKNCCVDKLTGKPRE